MNKTAYCPVCGNLFVVSSCQVYCNRKCKNKSYKQAQRELTKSINNEVKEPKKRGRKKKVKSVTDIAVEARQHGMSYGKYVALLESGRMVE